MKTLELDGKTLLMDDDVYEFLKDKRIEWTGGGYPMIRLHTMFFPRDGKLIDHKNCNIQDFRRSNLRSVTYSENNRNRRKRVGAASRFKGVKPQKNGTFAAELMVNSKYVFLGRYSNEEAAARAYDLAYLFFFPDHPNLNLPREQYEGLNLESELRKIIERRPLNNTSGYRGVFISRDKTKWYARYGRLPDGKPRHLGTFDTAEDAAKARDAFAAQHGIRNTRLNFPSFEEWLRRLGWPQQLMEPG